jgi:hypothetical protein
MDLPEGTPYPSITDSSGVNHSLRTISPLTVWCGLVIGDDWTVDGGNGFCWKCPQAYTEYHENKAWMALLDAARAMVENPASGDRRSALARMVEWWDGYMSDE